MLTQKLRTCIMSEFKFTCPSCHQHIKIGVEFESRRVDCPSCKTTLIVPAPPKAGEIPVATLAQPAARPKSAAPEPTTITPTAPAPAGNALKPSTPEPESTSPFVSAAPDQDAADQPAAGPVVMVPPISDRRVAVLTSKLKLEIAQAIRSRLADPARWLPGKKEAGAYNYAARREGERMVTVSPTDASATHLSLFGAVLLEFHRRNVMRVTTGRRKFLDEELTAAIQQALGRPPGDAPISEAEREALTHEQCLAVLDILEKRYEREAEAAEKRDVRRKIERIRLADLVKKLEKSSPVRAEEVACALYYELEELNQRLDELEQSPGGSASN